jgi:hypothetical protein
MAKIDTSSNGLYEGKTREEVQRYALSTRATVDPRSFFEIRDFGEDGVIVKENVGSTMLAALTLYDGMKSLVKTQVEEKLALSQDEKLLKEEIETEAERVEVESIRSMFGKGTEAAGFILQRFEEILETEKQKVLDIEVVNTEA